MADDNLASEHQLREVCDLVAVCLVRLNRSDRRIAKWRRLLRQAPVGLVSGAGFHLRLALYSRFATIVPEASWGRA